MKKQVFIFILALCSAVCAHAAKPTARSGSPLNLAPGSSWILTKSLTLKKTGLNPEEFVPYTNVWDLKKKAFARSRSSSTDSCEFRTTISKKILKAPFVKVQKSAVFKITNIQETTMSVLIDFTNLHANKSGVDHIQVTCSSYEQGLDSPAQKENFKASLSSSLSAVFNSKN